MPPAAEPAPRGPIPSVPGAGAHLEIPGSPKPLPVRYALVEASDLLPSHNAHTFAASPGYPAATNERDYQRSPEAQARVVRQAQALNPAFLLTDNPDALNGPPIATPSGMVLGGNSRAMSIQRAYRAGAADAYKRALIASAHRFGLDAAQVAAMNQPALVRVLPGEMAPPEAARLATGLNRSPTAALSPAELAASRGKLIGDRTLDTIGSILEANPRLSLRDAMAMGARLIVPALEQDGVITERERPAFVDQKTGSLTPAGRDYVERAVLGAVVPDSRTLDLAAPADLQKIASALGPLAFLRDAGPKWDIGPALVKALNARIEARARGLNVHDLFSQAGLFGDSPVDALGNGEAPGALWQAGSGQPPFVVLADALDWPAKDFRAALKRYAADARAAGHEGQGLLPGAAAPDPREALEAAFAFGEPDEPLGLSFRQAGAAEPQSARPLTKAEAMLLLPAALYRDPETGAILMSPRGHAIAASVLRRFGVRTRFSGFATDAAGAEKLRRALAASGHPDLAAAIPPEGPAIFALHGQPDTVATVEEELGHLRQAAADKGDPDAAMNTPEAASFLAEVPEDALARMRQRYAGEMGRKERQFGRGAGERHLASEIGVRLLNREYADLGLDRQAGDRLRERYIQGVERTWPDGWQRLFQDDRPGAGGNSAGRFSLRAGVARDAAAQRDTGARADLQAAGRGDGAGAVAGPLGQKIGAAVRAVVGALGKYPGVSGEAKTALRGYDAGREVRAVEMRRAAAALYGAVRANLGPDYQADLPALLKIQRNIARPGDPAYALTPAEMRVKRALVAVRDRITLHDVARGWLTPDSLEMRPEAAAQQLQEPERSNFLLAAGAWHVLAEAGGWVPRGRYADGDPEERQSQRAAIRSYLSRGAPIPDLPPPAEALLREWVQDAKEGAPAPYWPGSYTDDRASVRRAMQPGEPAKGAKGQRLHVRPRAHKAKVYPDFVAAENGGLHQQPDAVAVLMGRLDDSMQAADSADLLDRLSGLGPEEVRQPYVTEYRGEEMPAVEPGMRLARNLAALNTQLKLRMIGGENTVISRPLAEAIETAIGSAPEEATGPLAPLLTAARRYGRLGWLAQRMVNFWNISKHPVNIGSMAALRGYVEGTRALAGGRAGDAASDARMGLGGLLFWADPEVREGVATESGQLFDRALKAGAMHSGAGRARGFGANAAPRAEESVAQARRAVFGAGAEKPGQRLRRLAAELANLPHSAVFRYYDMGVRLKMFKELVSQGMTDQQAAAEVNRWLVDYDDVNRRGIGAVLNRVFYTLPWMKGSALAFAHAARRNPIAVLALLGAITGAMELENERATGHGMGENPPGYRDRAAAGRNSRGEREYLSPTDPATMVARGLIHPAAFAYNRLDPSIRALWSVAANQAYPPNGLPNLLTGAPAREYPVVGGAAEAAESAGNPAPAWRARLGQLASEAFGGPQRDIGRALSGNAPWYELAAPVSARADNPQSDLYDDEQRAVAMIGKVRGPERAKWLGPMRRAILAGAADYGRAAAAFRSSPPPSAAARAREARFLKEDHAGLERAARAYIGQ